jgi:hypothetical protein
VSPLSRKIAAAPHARFSFQRTPTRPSRRTTNLIPEDPFVNPRFVHLSKSSPLTGGDARYKGLRTACQAPECVYPLRQAGLPSGKS